ncbi:unnamed protein product, partial [Effrenium voratum]
PGRLDGALLDALQRAREIRGLSRLRFGEREPRALLHGRLRGGARSDRALEGIRPW